MDRPIGTLTTKARYALVDGDRMRMLTKAETIHFGGFPADYRLPDSMALVNHLIGNAVPPAIPAWFIGEIRRCA
jgi:DNA (cytosine-5)-methyltransferase 1